MNKIPWGPIRSCLEENFTFREIKRIVGYADIDMFLLAHLEQKSKGGTPKSELLSEIEKQISRMEVSIIGVVASRCCEEMLRMKPELIDELERVLSRVGWSFSGTTLLPVEIFDVSELKDIPKQAHEDIQKAASRLRDGDLSGALSASCGALDSVTSAIYQEFELGDFTKAAFQERIKKSIDAICIEENLLGELQDIGWVESDIKPFVSNLRGSLNQAAFVMQKLRPDMGDVHGSKPVISALIYDSIKWSLLLLRILATRKAK